MASPLVQKMKGKLQQTKGRIKRISGDELGGSIDQIKGNLNDQIAEARIRLNRNSRNKGWI